MHILYQKQWRWSTDVSIEVKWKAMNGSRNSKNIANHSYTESKYMPSNKRAKEWRIIKCIRDILMAGNGLCWKYASSSGECEWEMECREQLCAWQMIYTKWHNLKLIKSKQSIKTDIHLARWQNLRQFPMYMVFLLGAANLSQLFCFRGGLVWSAYTHWLLLPSPPHIFPSLPRNPGIRGIQSINHGTIWFNFRLTYNHLRD